MSHMQLFLFGARRTCLASGVNYATENAANGGARAYIVIASSTN